MLVVTFFPLTNHGMSGKPSGGVIENIKQYIALMHNTYILTYSAYR